MATVGFRIVILTLMPVLLAGAIVLVDRSAVSRERRLETFLVFLFAIGAAGAGIFNFIAHFLLSDTVAGP